MIKSFGYNLNTKKLSQYPRTALFLGHLGLGDQIWLVGAIRYIAKMYDYLDVACKEHNLNTLTMLYADTPNIRLLNVGFGNYTIYPSETQKGTIEFPIDNYCHVYKCGFYSHSISEFNEDFPGSFYDDLELDRSIRHTYFSIPLIHQSKSLYEFISSQPYIFVQTCSSDEVTSIISWDINDILTIDPNINQYLPDHPWYELANKFVNQPFLYYIDVIKHATELHLVNSSFYTLASQLYPLDAKVKLCYDRNSAKVISNYDFT